jgi:hypothetical protein
MENLFWRDKAAALDPAAYTYHRGSNANVTVPEGETWYAINLWWIWGSVGNSWSFFRQADTERMLMLPAGTSLKTTKAETFAYLCRPALVLDDPRYEDGRGLYFERLARLRELPLHTIGTATQGQHTQKTIPFPTDFERGLIVAVSTFDLAWTILVGPNFAAINTLNEISDRNPIRFSEKVTIPFQRSVFTAMRIQGLSNYSGQSTLYYCKLPVDW